MIETYTQEFRENLINEYVRAGLVAFLIRIPSLGVTDTPTTLQLEARKGLTMLEAVEAEIAVLNGYKRALVAATLNPSSNLYQTYYNLTSTFEASIEGNFPEATHICYARGANVTDMTNANGNNRGDTQGTLIKVEPLEGAPLILGSGTTLTHNSIFRLTSQNI